MQRSERHDKRELILDAALKVFSRNGVFGTRIADIATEAGIAYGLVYHYFRNKEEILTSIFEERWASITERLEEAALVGKDTRDRLRRATGVLLSGYRERPQVVELLLLEFTRTSKFLEPSQLDRIGRAFGVVRHILEEGQKAGEVRMGLSVDLLVLLFVGSVQMIIQSQVLGVFTGPGDFDERGPEYVSDVFLDGILTR